MASSPPAPMRPPPAPMKPPPSPIAPAKPKAADECLGNPHDAESAMLPPKPPPSPIAPPKPMLPPPSPMGPPKPPLAAKPSAMLPPKPPRPPKAMAPPKAALEESVQAQVPLVLEPTKEEDLKPTKEGDPKPELSPPYSIPEWSHAPGKPYKLEVLKEGFIIDLLEISEKGAYMFGRHESVDFVLDHPSVSRFHAVIQYNSKGDAFVFDTGSTHGTFINKRKVKEKKHVPLHVGDIIRFGVSSRLYIFQGPQELMPQEGLLRKDRRIIRQLEAIQSRADAEASLARATNEATGATWGMDFDSVEDAIRDEEKITWQTYSGQLNEKQQKTMDQITKRNEKLTNLRKEIDAIQAKDNAQGGLTQGQQTQISRNEKRIQELLEQLEGLEDSLNESIRETVLGRRRTAKERKKKFQDEDSDESDDDFYDRTKKKQKKEQQAESAASLLEKKENLEKQMDEIKDQIKAEEDKMLADKDEPQDKHSDDPLDAFMTDISTKIVEDSSTRLKSELQKLRTQCDQVTLLLKVADPTGEATRKLKAARTGGSDPLTLTSLSSTNASNIDPQSASEEGPVWMGAPRPEKPVEPVLKPMEEDATSDKFVHYKDREKLQENQVVAEEKEQETIADDIALLLRHKKGLVGDDDEAEKPAKKTRYRPKKTKGKKILGPEKPEFLDSEEQAFEAWVPPEGQTGDGRTSLNDKFGY